jgi:3-oxoacyl-[acyl-carrier protein] reductase
LEGRGVLVVGAGSPHGRAVALAAAGRGGAVVFSVSPGDEERAAEIERLAGGRARGVAADHTREDEAERLFGTAVDQLARLDVVVSTAPDPPPGPLLDVSKGQWEGVVSRGLRGAFLVSRLAVEELLAHGAGGRLVHVAPLVRPGAPAQVLAAAWLQALLALMRSTAKEYGARRVACNAVVPVPADAGVPGASPDVVMEAVLFLASPEASYLNGEALSVSCALP